ncbi:type II toxin-antitoxin system VapC family toxin [Silvibacterium dinghuense]|uniref:type II toxin-antitoxin system VapC family toxin n=1 Tax=Silvibacterium dinghuense TaxID=1560006 RepID=UPI0013E94C6F|nr:PIN domain-containing protein [Silvibacterium dinghuense]GGH06890.1 hypothetical protein GCM10011586_23870 [Silvibacterium dinghuense]
MISPVLLDASVIVALFHQRDAYHAMCVRALEELDRPLVTCEPVIMESCHLLKRSVGAVDAVVANIESGSFEMPWRLVDAASAVRALMEKYRDIPASLADACLIQMADELDTGDILTLDSDFRSYRWRRHNPFHLLIDRV